MIVGKSSSHVNLDGRVTCLYKHDRLVWVGTADCNVAIYDFFVEDSLPLIEISLKNHFPRSMIISMKLILKILFNIYILAMDEGNPLAVFLLVKKTESTKEKDQQQGIVPNSLLTWMPNVDLPTDCPASLKKSISRSEIQ